MYSASAWDFADGSNSSNYFNVTNVTMLLVEDDKSDSDNHKLPGVIGADRSSNSAIKMLANQGVIPKNIITLDWKQDRLWIGALPNKMDKTQADKYANFTLDKTMGDKWAVAIDAAYWRHGSSSDMEQALNVQSVKGQIAMFDSGHDRVCIPSSLKAAFEETFTFNCTKPTALGGDYTNCTDGFPHFAIVIGGFAYYFDNSQTSNYYYVDKTLKINLADECVSGYKNSWVLGVPFLKNFLTGLDDEANLGSIYADGWRVKYTAPLVISKTMIIVGVVVGVVVLIIIGIGVFCWMKRRGRGAEGLTEGFTSQN
jgi:hypothetical protein